MAAADYEVWVDWDADNGLYLGVFEVTQDGWYDRGTVPPESELSTDVAYSGDRSLKTLWRVNNPFRFDTAGQGFDEGRFGVNDLVEQREPAFAFSTSGQGFDDGYFGVDDPEEEANPRVRKRHTGLTVGDTYTVSAWMYIPSGNVPLHLGVVGYGSSAASTMNDEWERIEFSFQTDDPTVTVELIPENIDFSTDQTTYVDQISIWQGIENITPFLRATEDLTFRYGRDQSRSTSPISSGELSLLLDNQDRRFSPNNPASPLGEMLGPGKKVLVTATSDGKMHRMFEGRIDDFEIHPHIENRSVTLTAVDILAMLKENSLSTEVHKGLQTGEAIHAILDAVNWPEDNRSIDSGATSIAWWWAEGTSAEEAIQEIIAAEGPGSIVQVDGHGNFVFKDRHHRIRDERSKNSQVTYRDAGSEVLFSPPMEYDVGWKDLFNEVVFSIDTMVPDHDLQARHDVPGTFYTSTVVWDNEDVFTVPNGEVKTFVAEGNDPFIDAELPELDFDYSLVRGDVDIELSRTSGQTTEIKITSVGGEAIVNGMRLRAIPIVSKRTTQVQARDSASIDRFGKHTWDKELPWANENDAAAIAELILGQRSERLPIVSVVIKNGTADRLADILDRDISDRVRVIEEETFTNHEFYVESLEHTIIDGGYFHHNMVGMERVREQPDNVFTFDDDTRGFDDGLFGYRGQDQPDEVFILDESELDVGLLGH